ncbi:ABC transporter substrate-binding protein [Microbacterium sp.]|uniref:ABC transporter substrate-binding protein n=1 Tax=Microbacterium sp. TaxID=51671 RepID=UPI002E37A167|nr:ABC transporter substrate-binding protein [Microbacterium sp.]HEX5729345.1 ABC transporter substrate-binding protein [Microbacterium sp.]
MRAITGGIACARRRSLLGIALVLLLAGCGGGDEGAAPAGEGGTTKLAVQETAGVPSAFVAFGIEKGLFEKQKLEIDLQPTQGGAATIPALVSGDIQVGGSNVVSLLLASSKDLPIRAIAGGTTAQASGEKDFGALLAAKGKGISEPADLEGKTVAVNTLNNIAEVVVKAGLEKEGVDPDSLELSEVPFPEMEPALAKGSVDAAFSIEPFVTQSVEKGDKVLGYSYVDTEPNMQVGAYAVTNQFAESDPEAVKAFQAAVKETADYVGGHEDEFRTFLSENADMPPALAEKIVLPKWTGEVDADSVAKTAELMRRYGLVEDDVDPSKLLQGG